MKSDRNSKLESRWAVSCERSVSEYHVKKSVKVDVSNPRELIYLLLLPGLWIGALFMTRCNVPSFEDT